MRDFDIIGGRGVIFGVEVGREVEVGGVCVYFFLVKWEVVLWIKSEDEDGDGNLRSYLERFIKDSGKIKVLRNVICLLVCIKDLFGICDLSLYEIF